MVVNDLSYLLFNHSVVGVVRLKLPRISFGAIHIQSFQDCDGCKIVGRQPIDRRAEERRPLSDGWR